MYLSVTTADGQSADRLTRPPPLVAFLLILIVIVVILRVMTKRRLWVADVRACAVFALTGPIDLSDASAFVLGSGRNSNPLTSVNAAVFAPVAIARHRIAATVQPGRAASMRIIVRRPRISASVIRNILTDTESRM